MLVFAAAFMAAGVFLLPYQFPPETPILSASSIAGFNNSIAYLCFVVALPALAVLAAGELAGDSSVKILGNSEALFRRPDAFVIAVLAAHAALFGSLYLWKHGFVFAEALYFQETAYRLAAGAKPFVDFNFFYGPALLYPTAFLARYVGLPAAYALYYVVCYLFGLYLLFILLAALIDDRRWVRTWFAFFAFGFFNPITGLNYTFARFLLPPIALLAAWRCLQTPSVRRISSAACLLALAILCSPDIGVVTALGIGVLGTSRLVGDWQAGRSITPTAAVLTVILLGGLAMAGAASLLIDGTSQPALAYLTPIVTFSAGAWSTPIDPSAPMLALLAFSVLVAAILWSTWRAHPFSATASLMAGYAVMFVLMERAIFGKADVEHIAFSGLPVFCFAAGWSVAAAHRRSPAKWVAATLAVAVIAPLQFYHAMLFLPSLAWRTIPVAAAVESLPKATSASKEEIQRSLSRAVEYFGPDRPYYMHKLEYYRLPIYLRYQLKPVLYHPSLTSAFTRKDIEDVIADLRRSHAIVLARRSDLQGHAVAHLHPRWWHYVTSSPLPGSTVFNLTVEFQGRLEAPLVSFLNSSYDRRFEDGDVVGLVLQHDAIPGHALQ
jgi:hypothetical protein